MSLSAQPLVPEIFPAAGQRSARREGQQAAENGLRHGKISFLTLRFLP